MNKINFVMIVSILQISTSMSLANAEQICRTDNIVESASSSRYQVKPDNTVIDNQTGLMWKVCTEGTYGNKCGEGSPTAFNWASALLYPNVFNKKGFANHTDWRLPNIRELSTLVELQCMQPSINTKIFSNAPNYPVWSSSPYLPGPDFYTWQVDFRSGLINADDRIMTKYVRLVRNAETY